MKTYATLLLAIVFVFPFTCFSQKPKNATKSPENGKAILTPNNKDDDAPVIAAYYVEETINMTFGRRITKYEVSKLDMVNTYDLGPNNTRTVTPIYRKPKAKPTEVPLMAKIVVDVPNETVKPVKVEVAHVKEAPKYIDIDISRTYEKVLDKGYKSPDMLRKVADKSYFDGDMDEAAKYYGELLNMTPNMESIYYYRYAEALKATNQTDKANEMMVLFESKNTNSKVAAKK
ncbi:tetratricopeptide repeat protein [Flavobacterium branchiicola]|uniref:Tetratricopeptide repeat protein n=1 Tax=Flavobacterium branchiicola TaxID=1114875 RepID=A0ABV9PEB0_9FLAO|nr:tetratricopeptide repeat protein [Flavobacterium branchiicola]MBS7255078.1 tetratricopeptide repeat protein [Flavobacterium branchiicola]